MNASLVVAIVVAVVAALASCVGAAVAAKSANRASRSAEATNSLNHQIAAIDKDSDELKLAYLRLMQSMVVPENEAGRHSERFAAIELLLVCRGISERLMVAASGLHPFAAEERLDGLNEAMAEVRAAYQQNQRELGLLRQFSLAGEEGRRQLTRAAIRDIRRNGPADVAANGGPRPGQVGIVRKSR